MQIVVVIKIIEGKSNVEIDFSICINNKEKYQFSIRISILRDDGQLRMRIFISLRFTSPKKKLFEKQRRGLNDRDRVLKSVNLIPSISQAGTFSRAKCIGSPDLI